MTLPEQLIRPFDTRLFLTQLRNEGCSLGEPIHYFTTTTSTNDEAKNSARAGAVAGSLYVADHQTHGRGRRGRVWVAQANHQLLVSVLTRPKTCSSLSALTLAVGVALHRALTALCPSVEPAGRQESCSVPSSQGLAIKWPNDVEHSGRKLAGVLVETQFDERGAAAVIIGFGVNVLPVQVGDETHVNPISLRELGCETERERVLVAILTELQGALSEFEKRGLRSCTQYLNKHNALFGCPVSIDGKRGIAGNIGTDGALMLAVGANNVAITSGTVERLSNAPAGQN